MSNRSRRKTHKRNDGAKKHVKKHRFRILWFIAGIGICLAGSTLATTHHPCLEFIPVFLLDGFAYFVHGIGAIPLLKGIEPLWAIIVDL